MSNARPVVQDSMELAKRINDSTDIVTDLTDVVQSELPQKALQGDNEEATNSEILRAIANIDIDTSELAKEETLVQGVSGIRSDIANIPAPDLSTVAKQGDNEEATNTAILDAIEDAKNDVIFISDNVTQLALRPNKLYILPNRTQDMSFTLVNGDPNVMNEYHVIINFGNYETFPTFTFPNSVEFLEPIEDPIVYKFDKLELSILNDLCVWVAKDL